MGWCRLIARTHLGAAWSSGLASMACSSLLCPFASRPTEGQAAEGFLIGQ